jgi:hypothetical protein
VVNPPEEPPGPQFLDAGKLRHGVAALKCLPRMERRGELLIDATPVQRVDAWLATSLRALIEYRCRDQKIQVLLRPPMQPGARHLLAALLGEPPTKFVWDGRDGRGMDDELRGGWLAKLSSKGAIRHRVILPATRFTNTGVLDAASRRVPVLIREAGQPLPASFLVGTFCEFVENGLRYGRSSPIGTVGSLVCDPRRRYAEAVVVDLGPGLPTASLPCFFGALREGPLPSKASLASIPRLASAYGYDARMTIVTGGDVITWSSRRQMIDGDGWTRHATGVLPGFAAALRIHF